MIDTCDPSIATWSDDGTTFLVKDTEKFASDIIGQFFKVRPLRTVQLSLFHGILYAYAKFSLWYSA